MNQGRAGLRRRRVGTRISVWGSMVAELVRVQEEAAQAAAVAQRPVLQIPAVSYQTNILGFFEDCLGIAESSLAPYQIKILLAIQDSVNGIGDRQISCRSANGIGKTYLMPGVSLWLFGAFQDVFVNLTSAVDRQVKLNLWQPLMRLWATAPVQIGQKPAQNHHGGLVSSDLRNRIFGAAPRTKETAQGIRSSGLTVVIVDEASGVLDEVNDGLKNALTGQRGLRINLANPTRTSGWFANIFAKEIGKLFTISAFESPNVLAGTTVIPGLVSCEWVEEARKEWGTDDPRWIIHVLGQHLKEGQERVFSEALLDVFFDHSAQVDVEARLRVGIDLSEFGGDETILTYVRDKTIFKIAKFSGDFESLAAFLKEDVDERNALVTYDATGIGYKFAKYLEGAGFEVNPVHYGSRADNFKLYVAVKDELPWNFKEWIRSGGRCIVQDEKLREELGCSEFEYTSKFQIITNRKYLVRRKLGRSPDRMDSATLAVYRWEDDEGSRAMRTSHDEVAAAVLNPSYRKSTGFSYK